MRPNPGTKHIQQENGGVPLSWPDARPIPVTPILTPMLTVLICTHNRAYLLERLLASFNAAMRPAMPVRILVAANACTDNTVVRMLAYQSQQANKSWLSLRLIEVPTSGKSHALNRAIIEFTRCHLKS